MVHPATKRVVQAAIAALDTPLDIGFIFPPRDGEDRGRGVWTGKDLDLGTIINMLPKTAAANARGAHIYMRLGPSARESHPGIVMLDDLDLGTIERLKGDGLEPCLVIETSPGNHQAWIRLVDTGTVPYSAIHSILRQLAIKYDADPRAVSPLQPGRVPGFTNRKSKYRQANGNYPFVRLIEAHPGVTASAGPDLVARDRQNSHSTQAGRAAGAAPETPPPAAGARPGTSLEITAHLDAIHKEQRARIGREVAKGRRPLSAASQSEIDFATAKVALEEGITPDDIAAWLSIKRPAKHFSYPEQTVSAAAAFPDSKYRKF